MIGLAKACRSKRTRDAVIRDLATLYPVHRVARMLGISRLTVRRALRRRSA